MQCQMIGDASEHVGEPGTRADTGELRRDERRIDRRGALAAAVGPGEQPSLPSESNTSQSALGGVVARAPPAVIEEPTECIPAPDHVEPYVQAALAAVPGWMAGQAKALALYDRQFGILFGAEAARPREVIIQDWATDPFTATEADHTNGNAHPDYRPIALPAPWGERITLAGAEMAPEFGGYLEGALAAAEAAVIA